MPVGDPKGITQNINYMKKHLLVCAAVVSAGLISSRAEEAGPYSRLDAGFSTFNGLSGALKTGLSLSGAAGYKINQYVGFEAEVGYTHNRITGGLGRFETVPVLANVVLTAPVTEGLSLDFAAGAGYEFASVSTPYGGAVGEGTLGQLRAGVTLKISDRVSANVGYSIRAVFEDTSVTQNIFSGGISIKF